MGLMGREQGKVSPYRQIRPVSYDVEENPDVMLTESVEGEFLVDNYQTATYKDTGTGTYIKTFTPIVRSRIKVLHIACNSDSGGNNWYLYRGSISPANLLASYIGGSGDHSNSDYTFLVDEIIDQPLIFKYEIAGVLDSSSGLIKVLGLEENK